MSVGAVEAVEAVAAGQVGVFSNSQAATVGVGERTLSYQSRPGGRWRRVAPRVYEVVRSGSGRADWRRPFMAALLWAGDDGVLSHRSAGALLGFDGVEPGHVELRLTRRIRPPAGWTAHFRPAGPEPVVTTGLFRHTDALTTLVDLAQVLGDDEWEWALEGALRERQVRLADVEAAAKDQGQGGHRGVARIRRVLGRRPPGAAPTGSIRETQFVQLARRAGVDPPERQVPVCDGDRVIARLDLAWPRLGVFVEIDGRWHNDPEVGPYDRHRQNEVVELLGWRPFRYDSDDILRRPRYTTRRLRARFERARSGAWEAAQARPRT